MDSLALLTDFYQLTMLAGYFHSGKADQRAVFDLYFRKVPHAGGYCVAAGLGPALDYLEGLRFSGSDLDYLRGLGHFAADFLDWLREFRFRGEVHAIAEGTLVFPGEPLLRVEAALPEAQLVESALLNIVNFQTLIASKAARICSAAGPTEVLEFGLRRAQGVDGAMSASRAAYVGGCGATSNSLAGKIHGIPVRGTQAHSWVMSFGSELEAFRKYAQSYPDGCLLLVDTYDTLKSGVPHAITVGRELEAAGHRFTGIRLDSGDLTALSREARRMLDEAGLSGARIVASNDLDEYLIEKLRAEGARIDVWGVGTRLVTSQGDSALGGVYKLVAIEENGVLAPRIKLSADAVKVTVPGRKQVWRSPDFRGDTLALADEQVDGAQALLEPVMQGGRSGPRPTLASLRERTLEGLARLPEPHRRLREAERYPVRLSAQLEQLRNDLMEGAHAAR